MRSTAIWLASICCCAFGLRPIWVAVRRDTRVASNSFPTPFPGTAASLLIIERSLFFCLTTSSSRRSGVPTPMNPPTMMLEPGEIIAMASSTETALMIETPVSSRSVKGGRNADVDEAHQRSFDLHQGSPLFSPRDGYADAFERFGPELADLGVTAFRGCAHGVTERRWMAPLWILSSK